MLFWFLPIKFSFWSYYNCKGKHKICPIRSKWGDLASWAQLKLDPRWNCSTLLLKCLHKVHISTILEKGNYLKRCLCFNALCFSERDPETCWEESSTWNITWTDLITNILGSWDNFQRWKLGKSGFVIEHFPCKNIPKYSNLFLKEVFMIVMHEKELNMKFEKDAKLNLLEYFNA